VQPVEVRLGSRIYRHDNGTGCTVRTGMTVKSAPAILSSETRRKSAAAGPPATAPAAGSAGAARPAVGIDRQRAPIGVDQKELLSLVACRAHL
jgi:hypothetical protein